MQIPLCKDTEWDRTKASLGAALVNQVRLMLLFCKRIVRYICTGGCQARITELGLLLLESSTCVPTPG